MTLLELLTANRDNQHFFIDTDIISIHRAGNNWRVSQWNLGLPSVCLYLGDSDVEASVIFAEKATHENTKIPD